MRLISVCAIFVTLAGCGLPSSQPSVESPAKLGLSTEAVSLSEPVFTGVSLVSDDSLLCTLALPGNRRVFAAVRLSPGREIVASALEDEGVVQVLAGGEHLGTSWTKDRIVPGSNAEFVLMDAMPVDLPSIAGRRAGAAYTWAPVWLPFPGVNTPTPMADGRLSVDVKRVYPERDLMLSYCEDWETGTVSYALHSTTDFAVTQSLRIDSYDAESWITVSASPILQLDGPTMVVLELEPPGKKYWLRFLSLEPLADRGTVPILQPIDMRTSAFADPAEPGTVLVYATRRTNDAMEWVRQQVTLGEEGPRVTETVVLAGLPAEWPRAIAANDTYVWMQGTTANHIITHEIATGKRIAGENLPDGLVEGLVPGVPERDQSLVLSAAPSGRRVAYWRQGDALLTILSTDESDDPIVLRAETVAGRFN